MMMIVKLDLDDESLRRWWHGSLNTRECVILGQLKKQNGKRFLRVVLIAIIVPLGAQMGWVSHHLMKTNLLHNYDLTRNPLITYYVMGHVFLIVRSQFTINLLDIVLPFFICEYIFIRCIIYGTQSNNHIQLCVIWLVLID